MLEVAVVGVDGSGKSTLIRELRQELESLGLSTSLIDVPRYTEAGWFGSAMQSALAWAERRNRFVLAAFALPAALAFLVLRRRQQVDVILVEHHPNIEMPVYGHLYAGRVGFFAGSIYSRLFPRPDAVVRLSVPVDVAIQRIRGRGRTQQWYERPEKLRRQNHLIKLRCKKFGKNYICFADNNGEAVNKAAHAILQLAGKV